MTTFELDTSGVVVAHGYRRVGSTPVASYEWSDLTPFTQGYYAPHRLAGR